MSGSQISVLVVDDSALVRQMLTHLLDNDPEIKVVGSAADPYVARDKIKQLNPDVVTLDVEMPRMDGLEFLEKIMTLRPMPVVMVSSLTQQGADATIRALELGAVDFVAKPTADLAVGLEEQAAELVSKVKAAARATVRPRTARPAATTPVKAHGYLSTEKIFAIGASTGGVEALREVLAELPPDSPATLVTQHMPGGFTTSFANRLDGICAVSVREAADGDRALPGHVYIAPGEKHLELARSGANYICRLTDGPPVSGHKPSVDVLFRSVADKAAKNAVGIILTGMGRDGAAGMLELRQAGARTIGQDEKSCTVYGMPRAAMEAGAVEAQYPISHVAREMLKLVRSDKAVSSVRV